MVKTRSPGARDQRPFSGPPSDAGACTSGDVPVPSAAQLKALLELRESSPGDFEKLLECARSTNNKSEATANEASASDNSSTTSVSDGSMDTSSVGGSTVRELNEQLEEESGNAGNVSAATGNVDLSFSSEWQTRKRPRHKLSKSSSPAGDTTATKKGRVDADLVVFVKGVTFDIAKEATRQPIEFSRKLSSVAGQVGDVKLVKDSVRVTCLSPKQRTTMLGMTDWYGKVITVTEPWVKAGNQRPSTRPVRGIVFGVSEELSEADIATEIKASSARRLTRWSDGEKVKTGSVVVSFSDKLPESVYIGCLRFKVKPYIPQPIRCMKCQGFGHIAAHCKRQVRCVRCGKGHSVEECPVKDDLAQAVCVNCKGQHSAAFKGCSKYQEVSKALKVSVVDKVSYRDAVLKVKSGVLQRPREVTVGRPAHTSTPLPSTSRPSSGSSTTPARRELFQTTPTERVQPAEQARQERATAAEPTDDCTKKPSSSLTGYLKQITHYLLYTLAVLEGTKPVSEFPVLRSNLTQLACAVFGKHGSAPCLSPNCRITRD